MKRHFFTLIEVIFFTLLSAILIGYLLNFFSHMLIVEKKSEKLENSILQEAHLQTRLKTIFSALEKPYIYTQKNTSSSGLCLHCIFDNGVDLDTEFAKTIKAELYINADKKLILKTYPYPVKEKKYPYREETLLENVSSLHFAFLTKKGCQKELDAQSSIKPILIKIFYTLDNTEKSFSFLSSYKDFCLPVLNPG